ncbi:MAG: hypothetical protein FWF18_04445 [Dehalococcoidia bacterium]|nr:hypothetical protein [Dehalococcoidia bacterium]
MGSVWLILSIVFFTLYFSERSKVKERETRIDYLLSRLNSLEKATSDTSHPKADMPDTAAPSAQVIPPTAAPPSGYTISYCRSCGAKISSGSTPQATNYCKFCGAKLAAASTPEVTQIPQPAHKTALTPVSISKPEDVPPPWQKLSMATIVLYLGVLFILTAGTIFATTTWNTLSNQLRALIIFTLPIFFIAVSIITDKILKLSLTGRAFYYLGCFFIPVAFLAISQFAIMGEWYTFSGGGVYAIWTTCLALFACASAFGAWRYKSAVFVYLAGFSTTATVWFAARLVGGGAPVAIFAISALSLACILLLRHRRSGRIYHHLQIYSYLNVLLGFLLSFAYDETAPIFHLLAIFVLFAAYTFSVINPSKARWVFLAGYSIAAVWFLRNIAVLLFGSFTSIDDRVVFMAIGLGVLFFVFRFAPKIFGVKIRTMLSDVIFAPLLACLILLWLPSCWNDLFHTWWMIVSITILAVICTVIGTDREKDYARSFVYLVPFVLLGLCAPIMSITRHMASNVLEWPPPGPGAEYVAAFLTFAAVAAAGAALNFLKTGVLQKRFSDSFNIAVMLWGGIWCQVMIFADSYLAGWYMLSLGLYSAAVFYAGYKNGAYQSLWVWLGGFTLALSPFMFALSYTNPSWFILLNILALSATVVMIVPVIAYIRKKQPVLPQLASISAILLNFCAVFCIIEYTALNHPSGIVAAVAIALLSIFSLFLAKQNAMNFIGVVSLWAIALLGSSQLSGFSYGGDKYYVPLLTTGIMFAVMLILGRLLFGKYLLRQTKQGKFFDYLSLSGAITPFVFWASPVLLGVSNTKIGHGALLLTIVYVLSFFGRNISAGYKSFNKFILSVVTVLGAIAVWTQPYFTLPNLIETEFSLSIMLIATAILSMIWRRSIFARHGMFTASVFAVIVQFGDIVTGDNVLFDAILLGAIVAILLFASFFLKRRRWFALAAVTLLVSAIYLSKDFWTSISWWVYLLVCGTIMVVVAALYEYKRRSGKTHKNSTNGQSP